VSAIPINRLPQSYPFMETVRADTLQTYNSPSGLGLAYLFYSYLSMESQWLWILLGKSTSTNNLSNENSFDYVKK
jgi:hypothetical protein